MFCLALGIFSYLFLILGLSDLPQWIKFLNADTPDYARSDSIVYMELAAKLASLAQFVFTGQVILNRFFSGIQALNSQTFS